MGKFFVARSIASLLFLALIGSAGAQQTLQWQGQSPGTSFDNYNTHNVVDAQGNLYLMWSDYSSPYSVGFGATGTNRLDKIAPNKSIYYCLHPDEVGAPYDIEISPANGKPQILLVVTTLDQAYMRFSEYDTNGKALWPSPVVVPCSGSVTDSVDSEGNVSILSTQPPKTLNGIGFLKISSKGVVGPWVLNSAVQLGYPTTALPNGNWLLYGDLNGNAKGTNSVGIFSPSTGKQVVGGSGFAYYKIAVAADGTFALCGFNSLQSPLSLKTYNINGTLLGAYTSPKTFIVGDLTFDAKDNLYISQGGEHGAGTSLVEPIQKFTRGASPSWTVEVPANYDYSWDFQGANDGIFFFYTTSGQTTNSETFYHLNSTGQVDMTEPFPLFPGNLIVTSGTHNDNFVTYQPDQSNLTQQVVSHYVNKASVSAP